MHGEGALEFTCKPQEWFPHPVLYSPNWAISTASIYRGAWDNNLPHGQGLLTWGYGLSYEGAFLKGAMTGKATLRGGFEHDCERDGFLWREYVGDFQDGYFHGHGTLKFSVYVDQDLRCIDRLDTWDVYTGHFRHGMMDGFGRLSFNHCPLGFCDENGPAPSHIAPPGGVSFRRCCHKEAEVHFSDEDSLMMNPAEICSILEEGHVYCGDFRQMCLKGPACISSRI